MDFNISNIKKGWKTTTAGVILFTSAIVSIFITELNINWVDVLPVLVTSLVLIGISDPKKKQKDI